ncbi:hypothetical protein L195_g062244, partial [Trifolium pratense]
WFYSWNQENFKADRKSFSLALIGRFGAQMETTVLEKPETQGKTWTEMEIKVESVLEVIETGVEGESEIGAEIS